MGGQNIIVFLFVLFPCTLHAQLGLTFPAEYIDFTLDSVYFSVNGKYTFVHDAKVVSQHRIIYPFPIKTTDINDISVVNITKKNAVAYTRKEDFIQFDLLFEPQDTLEVCISYKQKTREVNTYILKSTRFWNAPLKTAKYTLTAKDPIRIDHFSYKPDRTVKKAGETVYYWSKKRFYPKEDFIVTVK
jgi:hypothetical protein